MNGQTYALHFDREHGRWYLVTSGMNGMKAIPVVNDDEIGVMPTMVVPVGDGGQASVN